MFVACGIWCLADVSSVSPSSEQTLKNPSVFHRPKKSHQPVDVTELSKNIKDSRDLCLSKGVAFMTEREGSVSHLKHETFSSLQYATDFGTIFIRNP